MIIIDQHAELSEAVAVSNEILTGLSTIIKIAEDSNQKEEILAEAYSMIENIQVPRIFFLFGFV